MVNISKVDDSTIKFTFTDNDRYLYNGEISLPLNSLILELDASDMVIFKKIDGDVFVTFLISNSNFDTKEDLEEFYATSMVGSTGGGGGITSGEVQTMIDESISGKADTSAVTESINAAVSGKQDTLSAGTGIEISGNVISATGGGATYSAGTGIEIDSADTITAIYEGYPQVDDEAKTTRLSNATDPFYVMSTNVASTSGATRFKVGGRNRIATYDFAQHTATIYGEEWPDYLTWQWSDSYNMFLITPLQSIPSATADTISSGTTFVMPSGVTLVNSGKTTSVITDLTTKADNAIVDIAVGIDNNGFTYGYYKPGDTLPHWAAMVGIKGGLTNDNGALTTKVLKSLSEHLYDIDISTIYSNHINLEPATSVQFDFKNNLSDYSVWIYTNVFGEEQIIEYDGSVITGLSGVTVTKEDSHVVVTAIDNPYAETPYRVTGLDSNGWLSECFSNLQAYGYEYTTIDNAVETILSGKQDTLSAGTGIEISGNVISATGGGGGTVSSAITSGDTNAVAGGAVYDKFDEVEQVTAAALNNLSAAFDGLKLKKLTQAQYDALSPNYDNNTLYVII